MTVAGTYPGELDWEGFLVPLPPPTVETCLHVIQGTTVLIQAEGSAHACMVQVRAQQTMSPSKAKCIRNMQETVCAEGGVKERGESEYGKGMEAQYQCD